MNQGIQLTNPNADNYAAFIVGNADARDHLVMRDMQSTEDYVVHENCYKDQHLVLCGAGPSLADNAVEWCPKGDQVWGCNSAVIWLAEHGHKATHGFTIDQGEPMVEEWRSAPDVEYLLATTVHPLLTEHLVAAGRKVRFFHNYVGMRGRPVACDGGQLSYEDWLYGSLFPSTVRVGDGLNSVNRAIALAEFCGFSQISVLGADCSLRVKGRAPRKDGKRGDGKYMQWLKDNTIMHADGGNALASGATHHVFEADIDGRYWVTKPDMLVSAIDLVKMQRTYGVKLNLVGDTLPNALKDKDDEFLARCVKFG
jgi:hypothetical protein